MYPGSLLSSNLDSVRLVVLLVRTSTTRTRQLETVEIEYQQGLYKPRNQTDDNVAVEITNTCERIKQRPSHFPRVRNERSTNSLSPSLIDDRNVSLVPHERVRSCSRVKLITIERQSSFWDSERVRDSTYLVPVDILLRIWADCHAPWHLVIH